MRYRVDFRRGCRLAIWLEMPDRLSVIKLFNELAAVHDAADGKKTELISVIEDPIT